MFRSEGTKIIRTPTRTPNANAYAERWVGTLRRECLGWIRIVNRHQLEHVLHAYTAHHSGHRPDRSLSLQPPDGDNPRAHRCSAAAHPEQTLLEGLINEHEATA